MLQTVHSLLDPLVIIKTLGLIGVILIIFAESGLFFGFFFPGDSLLFTAGFLASQGFISPTGLFIGAFVAAILGDSVGYAFGKKIGPKIFTKDDSFFFNKKYIARSEHFYEKYGKKTIILARFIPIVRTFAPILAGVGNMSYRNFISYNVIGGLIWSVGVSAIGFGLGAVVPNADSYITPLVALIIIISLIPPVREYLKSRKTVKLGHMNKPDKKYVYHGSRELFETVTPKRQVRGRFLKDGTHEVIFDEISFHATPYKWIAIAYTFDPKQYEINGKISHYNMGVSLYNHAEELEIWGFNSLEESLKEMYGNGGYLFIFEKEKFFHKEGLGNLEVITKDNIKPMKIERIDDPVGELRKLGIKFNFVDLSKPENEKLRDVS